MAKITSKLQVTIPKRIADEYGIGPGDEVEFVPAGDNIRLVPAGRPTTGALSPAERLRLFDEDTMRQRRREKDMKLPVEGPRERDWRRDDLYTRGKTR